MTFNDLNYLQMTFRRKTTVPPPESSEMLQKLQTVEFVARIVLVLLTKNMIFTVFR